MIRDSKHVIAVRDLAVSARYYEQVLGFKVVEIGDEGWRFFVKDQVTIMAGECPDVLPASETGDHAYFAYFVLDSIDEYYRQVKLAGAELIKSIRDEPWGMREFAIRTVDGHRIAFGKESSA